jgi:hypothetical protein
LTEHPVLKLSRFNGTWFNYLIVCDSRRHRIDLFIDPIQTDQNYYLFQGANQSNLALSADFRSQLARTGYTFESLLFGELGPYSFLYTDGQLESGRVSCKRSFFETCYILGKFSASASQTVGTTTQGGRFHLFSVSNFLNEQLLTKNMLALSIRRLASNTDPHFIGRKSFVESPGFYDYDNPTAPITQIIHKIMLAFKLFDNDLSRVLNEAGFGRVFN